MPVELFHWNPKRAVLRGRIGRRIPVRRYVNNFGDMIGPLLVNRLLEELDLDPESGSGRLISVGSSLHFARPGDVVWGSGVNGKALQVSDARDVDVRAVRGPRTRRHLEATGAVVPKVFGDPGLLWPRFWPRASYLETGSTTRDLVVLPNLHDWPTYRAHPQAVRPTAPVHDVIRAIASSEFVVASSLHGIVLADAFGIPARMLNPRSEPPFKYEDYLEGTGRSWYPPAETVDDAQRSGPHPSLDWDSGPLLEAFPAGLWSARAGSTTGA